MSDKLYPNSVYRLVRLALADPRRMEVLGMPLELFFRSKPDDIFQMQRYGKTLATPFGVAAGPHTQLAQNIASAYLCGARYIELKTVQTLDTLRIAKPCIDMTDLGYNCEWSQELTLEQSYLEYLKAFVLIHVLRDSFEMPSAPDFIFNMSVGYSLEGIKSPTMQVFFDRMTYCAEAIETAKKEIAPIYPHSMLLDIPHSLSNSVTVSTMHGCPPEEIEKIGRYLIEERGFHTTIKLNPTLLGAEPLRYILNDSLGFDLEVPDAAFARALCYAEGLDVIRSLRAAADKAGVCFSLKLTNTLECVRRNQRLPESEKNVYMSGRALHPIGINLAAKLQADFNGALDISFAGGVDTFNAPAVLSCGLKPVTVCSDLLKPGGYGRLSQYPETLEQEMALVEAHSLDEFVHARAALSSGDSPDLSKAALHNLQKYAREVLIDKRYSQCAFPYENIKTRRPLPIYDCAASPCMSACPTGQEIPRYLEYTARGDYDQAWQTIAATNPFAHVQGMVCDHKCSTKCTRINYDTPLRIREIKRFHAECNQRAPFVPQEAHGKKVAIIGAGPSGLSCAYYLALHGFEVQMYDARENPGGMAGNGIPAFRLPDFSLACDIQNVLNLGVILHSAVTVDAPMFEKIRQDYDYVYLATGAQANIPLGIENDDAPGVYSQLEFLAAVRSGQAPELGDKVLVIGAGNSAMDAARTAKRLAPQAQVCIVYRRTRDEMPCAAEELQEALEEGIELLELHAPERVQLVIDPRSGQKKLVGLECSPMKLLADPEGGRPKPVKSGLPPHVLSATAIIAALGQRIILDFLPAELEKSPRGTVVVTACATSLPNVFAGGDVTRGASSLINAVGDGRLAASAIMRSAGLRQQTLSPADDRKTDLMALRVRQARRIFGQSVEMLPGAERLNFELFTRTLTPRAAQKEASRCLQCDVVCNVCTTVCPNRANIPVAGLDMTYLNQKAVRRDSNVEVQTLGETRIQQPYQIVHFADNCNECGNCETFCPSAGAPYKTKTRFHRSRFSFEADTEGYYWKRPNLLLGKRNNQLCSLEWLGVQYLYQDAKCHVVLEAEKLAAVQVQLTEGVDSLDLVPICRMVIAFKLGIDIPVIGEGLSAHEDKGTRAQCFTESR